jgi:hypothetical protein
MFSLMGNKPGLLLIEGDADTLAREGHTRFGDELHRTFAGADGLRFYREQLRSSAQVRGACVRAKFTRYPSIVMVAHGGPEGVMVAPDLALSWDEVGEALAPLEPKTIVAIACFAGLSGPTTSLFARIPTLNTIVGSPAPVTPSQATLAIFEATAAACLREVPTDAATLLLMLNAAVTEGVLFRRTRDGTTSASPEELALSDVFGLLAWSVMSQR